MVASSWKDESDEKKESEPDSFFSKSSKKERKKRKNSTSPNVIAKRAKMKTGREEEDVKEEEESKPRVSVIVDWVKRNGFLSYPVDNYDTTRCFLFHFRRVGWIASYRSIG